MTPPETRVSLILRLLDPADAEAWEEFARGYEPFVYGVARRRGMQHADAQELAQDVLLAVSRAVERWDPDPARGRFRDWLFRIARNQVVNYLTRGRRQPLAAGDSQTARLLRNLPAPSDERETEEDQQAFRRELFLHAAQLVQARVREKTWQAFWQTSVKGLSPSEVAERLQISIGSVYIARSRVMARMRNEVDRLLGEPPAPPASDASS